MIDGASPSRHQNSTGEGADACLFGEHVGEAATGDVAENGRENGREQWDRWLSMKALKRER